MTIRRLHDRRRSPPFAAACAFIAWLCCIAAPVLALDVEGEWYVLVHFEERAPDGSEHVVAEEAVPGVDYRDAVWRFERSGDGLRWTVFSDVTFRDETGRYEDVRGSRARLRHAWRPSAAQLREIRAGLEVDERTARSKRLHRRGRDGFASGGSARAGSASAVAYGEHWEVAGLRGDVSFEQSATLSSGRSDTVEGVTRFAADAVDDEAGRIEGGYARDRSETGRFFMWRKGVAHPSDAAFAAEDGAASLFGPGGLARTDAAALQALLDRLAEPGAREDPALRGEIRAGIEGLVEASFTRQGRSLRQHRGEIDALVDEVERLVVVEGVALEEIDRRFAAGDLAT